MRISDWSSDVCSTDLLGALIGEVERQAGAIAAPVDTGAEHNRAAIFVVDRDITPAAGAVVADVHGAIGTHPGPEIEGAADMGMRTDIEGNADGTGFLRADGCMC